MQAGRTPLHWAAANGHINICETLLDWDSAVDARDGMGDTAFHLAACHGRTLCAMTLAARGADTKQVNNFGWSAIHHASWHGHAETVGELVDALSLRELLDAPDQAGHRPIHLAVLRGHLKVVECVIMLGGCTSPAGPCGYTPLHYAARQGSNEICRFLSDHGANQYSVDEDGFLPSDFSPQPVDVSAQPNFITGEVEAETEYVGSFVYHTHPSQGNPFVDHEQNIQFFSAVYPQQVCVCAQQGMKSGVEPWPDLKREDVKGQGFS